MSSRYLRLILGVSALAVLSGCEKRVAKKPVVVTHSSPILVADGSMIVRQKPRFHVHGSREIHFCEDGGAAQTISVLNTNISVSVSGLNWTITSASGGATVSTTNQGHDIIAMGPNVFTLIDTDATWGPGAEVSGVRLSPAQLTFPNHDGTDQTLTCPSRQCQIVIRYTWTDGGSGCQ